MLEAAPVAALDSFISGLPLGLAPVSQGGSNLSGGQCQRVSFARGVLAAAGSSVLLLDEPTSALNPVTEAIVYDPHVCCLPRRLCVASVHRLEPPRPIRSSGASPLNH